MNSQCKTLRFLVDKWCGNEDLRITRPGRSRAMPWRMVRVELIRLSGAPAIVFFRHGDGSWCVYPPPAFPSGMH